MAGKISSSASGVQGADGTRASAALSTNSRVRTSRGFVGLVSDVVVFPAAVGLWLIPNQRVRVSNMPTIGASSVGVYLHPNPNQAGLMQVVEGDPRVEAS